MKAISDRFLVRHSLAGDSAAFEKLVKSHERLVAHIVFRMIRTERDREDICQDIFIKVYRNLSSFKFKCRLSTWIATIAFNTCRNHLEKRRMPLHEDIKQAGESVVDVKSEIEKPDALVERNDTAEHVRKQIESLPLHYRTVLTLYHLEDMSYREIGQIMDMPEGTVKSYLFRARRILRDRLNARYKPEELWKEAI